MLLAPHAGRIAGQSITHQRINTQLALGFAVHSATSKLKALTISPSPAEQKSILPDTNPLDAREALNLTTKIKRVRFQDEAHLTTVHAISSVLMFEKKENLWLDKDDIANARNKTKLIAAHIKKRHKANPMLYSTLGRGLESKIELIRKAKRIQFQLHFLAFQKKAINKRNATENKNRLDQAATLANALRQYSQRRSRKDLDFALLLAEVDELLALEVYKKAQLVPEQNNRLTQLPHSPAANTTLVTV